jgi:hypothetical protein
MDLPGVRSGISSPVAVGVGCEAGEPGKGTTPAHQPLGLETRPDQRARRIPFLFPAASEGLSQLATVLRGLLKGIDSAMAW